MSQNLLKIHDGRNSFWQLYTGRQLIVFSDSVTDVHLSHKGINSFDELKIKNENNMCVYDIPNVSFADSKKPNCVYFKN